MSYYIDPLMNQKRLVKKDNIVQKNILVSRFDFQLPSLNSHNRNFTTTSQERRDIIFADSKKITHLVEMTR
jgi:hypothetical protein